MEKQYEAPKLVLVGRAEEVVLGIPHLGFDMSEDLSMTISNTRRISSRNQNQTGVCDPCSFACPNGAAPNMSTTQSTKFSHGGTRAVRRHRRHGYRNFGTRSFRHRPSKDNEHWRNRTLR